MKALVDTNMLLAIAQFKVDVLGELRKLGYAPVVLSCVKGEIEKISKGKGKDARAAKTALILLERKKAEVAEKEGPTDRALLEVAKEKGWAVATNDLALIKRLKAAEIPVIRLRQRKLLVLE
jgi:hypothetical protein